MSPVQNSKFKAQRTINEPFLCNKYRRIPPKNLQQTSSLIFMKSTHEVLIAFVQCTLGLKVHGFSQRVCGVYKCKRESHDK